jgi:hypothetical protein
MVRNALSRADEKHAGVYGGPILAAFADVGDNRRAQELINLIPSLQRAKYYAVLLSRTLHGSQDFHKILHQIDQEPISTQSDLYWKISKLLWQDNEYAHAVAIVAKIKKTDHALATDIANVLLEIGNHPNSENMKNAIVTLSDIASPWPATEAFVRIGYWDKAEYKAAEIEDKLGKEIAKRDIALAAISSGDYERADRISWSVDRDNELQIKVALASARKDTAKLSEEIKNIISEEPNPSLVVDTYRYIAYLALLGDHKEALSLFTSLPPHFPFYLTAWAILSSNPTAKTVTTVEKVAQTRTGKADKAIINLAFALLQNDAQKMEIFTSSLNQEFHDTEIRYIAAAVLDWSKELEGNTTLHQVLTKMYSQPMNDKLATFLLRKCSERGLLDNKTYELRNQISMSWRRAEVESTHVVNSAATWSIKKLKSAIDEIQNDTARESARYDTARALIKAGKPHDAIDLVKNWRQFRRFEIFGLAAALIN